MAFVQQETLPLGSWLSELIDVFTPGSSGGGGTFPSLPGAGSTGNPYFPYNSSNVYTPPATQAMLDADDLALIRAWSIAVKAEGGVPTRMPAGHTNAGQLASRDTGPGTSYPTAVPPYDYSLAPTNVLAADNRVSLRIADQVDAIVPPALDDPTGFGADLQKYLLWGGIGLAAVLIIPPLLRGRD